MHYQFIRYNLPDKKFFFFLADASFSYFYWISFALLVLITRWLRLLTRGSSYFVLKIFNFDVNLRLIEESFEESHPVQRLHDQVCSLFT